jgi:hypothetical protein
MTQANASFASWDDVVETMTSHVGHYAAHGGGENALVGLRAEGAVTLQYAGRVVLELFQNALDRAVRRVVVRFDGEHLVVGNDGSGVSVDPGYDYAHPIEGEGRSDFHALCALHTSNKCPDRQFGSKGIGFRSVFGVSGEARLWTRCADGGWWGMELRQQLVPSNWCDSELPELDAVVREAGAQPRPSFHFPRLLRSAHDPVAACEGIHTVFVVRVAKEKHSDQILREVKRLAVTRFQFVGLRRSGVMFEINGARVSSESGWMLRTSEPYHAGFVDLAALAQKAHHPVSAPRVSIAWPSAAVSADRSPKGWFYNHLPTRMSTGLPIDVHADFQVKADREGMALSADDDVGRYNLALLQRAAQGHVEILWDEASRPEPREDFWLLAGRPTDARQEWTVALGAALFPNGTLDVWVDLAEEYFASSTPVRAAREFWSASLQWLRSLVGYSEYSQTWANKAHELCRALSCKDVPLIPIDGEVGSRLQPLPSRETSGRRARRVFLRSAQSARSLLAIPDVLVRQGRVVTTFPLERFEAPALIRPFVENEILAELRQIPHHSDRLDASGPLSPEEQGSLLLFAYRLTLGRRPGHFAWRAFADNDESERVGRALSTMFLPTVNGEWEPARQLSLERVDIERLVALTTPGLDPEPFLTILGVAPAGGIPILEDGELGLVPSQPHPPRPQPAGERSPLPALQPTLRPGVEPRAVRASTDGLPPDTHRSSVHATVRNTSWISSCRFRSFEGVPSLPSFVSPLDVVVRSNDRQRTLFAVPEAEEDEAHLAMLGALVRPNDDSQRGRVSLVLNRLRERIPHPGELSASTGLLLAALFNRLLPLLGEAEVDVPVLVEQNGLRRWLGGGEEAWLARREERQVMRRFYPDLCLVAADYRKGLPEQLGVREAKLRQRVRPDLSEAVSSERAQALVRRVEPHLAVFAAVAEQSRLVEERLSPERFERAWRMQRPVLEVGDAWMEVGVDGPKRAPRDWGKLRYEDVFYVPGPRDDIPGVIIFDIDPKHGSDPDEVPPLRYFGDALAALLVNNTLLGAAFAQVLASIDEQRIEDYIERHHLQDLVKEWQNKIRPLSDEQRQRLVDVLGHICADPGGVLARGRISRKDLRSDLELQTVPAVVTWLGQRVPRELTSYLPTVVVHLNNAECWRKWWGDWNAPLNTLVEVFGDLPDSWKRDVQKAAGRSFANLVFSPSALVQAYLTTCGHEIGDLEKRLAEIAPIFDKVTAPPLALAATVWRVGRGRSGAGQGGPHRKLTTDDLIEKSIALGAVGDAAERALLAWVVERVKPLRGHKGFEDALLGVFKPGTRTRTQMQDAVGRGDLARALHVAEHWSGAGFDIIGVEMVEGQLVPIRYECKALGTSGRLAYIHLSRNELAVARRVQREGPGVWKLVGVQPDGTCVDFTPAIADLLAEDELPLQGLFQRGLEPDGFRLVVERGSSTSV